MRLRRRIPLLALLFLPLASACGTVKDIIELTDGLHEVFTEGEFHVKRDASDDRVLLITVENGGQKTPAERAAAARRAAEHVRDNFPAYDDLKAVKVVYTGDASSSALADASTFVITREQLAQPDPVYIPPARPESRPAVDGPPMMNLDSINAQMDSISAHADSMLKDSRRQMEEMEKDMKEKMRGM